MMRVGWLTDLHLDHVALQAWERWLSDLRALRADRILITGDISEGPDVFFQLSRLAAATDLPIDFVLGNHDFYGSSIEEFRRQATLHCRDSVGLNYLTGAAPYQLSGAVGLVGEDGWGDARVGDYESSYVRLSDFERILDLQSRDKSARAAVLQQIGRESAERLAPALAASLAHNAVTIVATHVPPFRESCWYRGETADDNWAPFFVCGAIGDLLYQVARDRPDRRLLVLCGHGHHAGSAQVLPNLHVVTGGAEYGAPTIAGVLQVDRDDARLLDKPA